ncbi:NAD-dependent epimerase/dehydratase [alpha proteobacterium U9-1i]|nr:NAD-dependent epimerase/dehydratase [alpha proteobacterium U9-1i]
MGDLIVVFGGSGFVGRHVVRALAKSGKRVRVAMRRPHLGADLRVLGDVGQIQIVQANVRFPDSVDAALEDADGVVNLVGVLAEHGKQNFNTLHAEAPGVIAEAAAKRGIKRFVQVSAIGAAPKGARYARTKFAGEQNARSHVPQTVVLRPSILFGSGDTFFNRFAEMARFAPALPLLGGGKTKFQPLFAGDMADAVCAALDRADARGRTFELGGPQVYSFKQLMQFLTAEIARPRALLDIPFFIAQPLGIFIGWASALNPFADPPLTGDQVTMLQKDNVVGQDPQAGTIADLGVASLESIEAIVPSYIWRFRPYGQFQTKQSAT